MRELCNGVPGTAPAAPARERRAAVRFPCALTTDCHPVPDGDPLCAGRVRDISTAGMGLVVDRYVEPETCLAVELQSEDGELGYTLMVLVRNARCLGEEGWLLGCALARDLSPYELEALL